MDRCQATIIRHLEYHAWATGKALESVEALSSEELHRDMMNSHSSVWGTLVHLYQADSIWLSRHQGVTGKKLSDFAPEETVAGLRSQWARVHSALLAYATTLPDGGWDQVLEYRFLNGQEAKTVIYDNLLHVVNHGTYHRGQIVTMLRQLGASPIGTDFIAYVRELQEKSGAAKAG